MTENSIEFDAIVFDCDGTLAAVEGIDELARMTNVYQEVKAMTDKVMSVGGLNADIYAQRLDLVRPHKSHVTQLGQLYLQHAVPGIKEIIHLFQKLGKTVYVISAGLYPAVADFANQLGVPVGQVYAVDIYFDKQGNYQDFERHSPLVNNHGKQDILKTLEHKHQNLCFIGDGANDLATKDVVERFIGYGGIYPREHIAKQADYYSYEADMAAILPLCLSKEEINYLDKEDQLFYQRGLRHDETV